MWYCSAEDNHSLLQTIAEEARAALLYEQDGTEDNAWWLQRAAVSDEDIVMAVAGLRLAGSSVWREVLKAYFHESEERYTAAHELVHHFEALLGTKRADRVASQE